MKTDRQVIIRGTEKLVRAGRVLGRRVHRSRSRYYQWLRPQLEFLSDDSKLKLLRLGNQFGGKTTAGLSEVNWRCAGNHPFVDVRNPPIEAWIICASWSQSIAIQAKFWALCDRDELAENTVFNPVLGFRGKNPAVQYKNGSIVRFKTTNQGGLNLAGATIHLVLIDEPTAERVFEELRKRVMKTAGIIMATLTPINGPTEYLRELVEAGIVSGTHYPLTADMLIPVGAHEPIQLDDGTPMDAEWVESYRAGVLSREAPIVIDGEWETRVEGNVFRAFDPTVGGAHIITEAPRVNMTLAIGIDHGMKDFKQVAILVGLDTSGEHPRLWVLDEYVGGIDTTPKDDAIEILAMLKRWGWKWSDLSEAMGDKPYDAARVVGKIGRKSNAELQAAIARLTGRKRKALVPPIRQAKTGRGGGRGSIDRGCTWLHRAMVREGHFHIMAHCKRTIEAIEKWDWTDSDFKDPIDALRYSTWKWAMRGSRKSGGRSPLYVY